MCFVEADRTSRTHVAKLPLAALCKKIRLHAKDQILGLGLHAISHLLVELSLDFFCARGPKDPKLWLPWLASRGVSRKLETTQPDKIALLRPPQKLEDGTIQRECQHGGSANSNSFQGI